MKFTLNKRKMIPSAKTMFSHHNLTHGILEKMKMGSISARNSACNWREANKFQTGKNDSYLSSLAYSLNLVHFSNTKNRKSQQFLEFGSYDNFMYR